MPWNPDRLLHLSEQSDLGLYCLQHRLFCTQADERAEGKDMRFPTMCNPQSLRCKATD